MSDAEPRPAYAQSSFVAAAFTLHFIPGEGWCRRRESKSIEVKRGTRSSCAVLPHPVVSVFVVPVRLVFPPDEVTHETAGNDVFGVPYCPVS